MCSFTQRGTLPEIQNDLCRIGNSNLTAIRYQDESVGPSIRPYAGAVDPGFFVVNDNPQPYVAGGCRQFLDNEGMDATELPPHLLTQIQ